MQEHWDFFLMREKYITHCNNSRIIVHLFSCAYACVGPVFTWKKSVLCYNTCFGSENITSRKFSFFKKISCHRRSLQSVSYKLTCSRYNCISVKIQTSTWDEKELEFVLYNKWLGYRLWEKLLMTFLIKSCQVT